MNEWVSVKDKVPEEGVEVLVYSLKYEGKYLIDYRIDFVETAIWARTALNDQAQNNVTHWMLLPEPPN